MSPVPPPIDEPVARLVYSDLGLPDLFARQAAQAGMAVRTLRVDELAGAVSEVMRNRGWRRIAVGPALRAAVQEEVRDADFAGALPWAAVAETGSLVFRGPAPPLPMVVVIEPRILVPDLLDLFQELAAEPAGETHILTGPEAMEVMVLR